MIDHNKLTNTKITPLTPAEYQQMVYGWNQTERDYPHDKTLHQLFEEQVENTPNNIAVVYEDQHRTYGQLNQQANQLARHIRRCYEQTTEQSLEPDTLIALCVERGIDMIVAIFAVLKAGGAYVPVDPNYPDERIAYILQDTQTKLVLTQAPLQTRLQTLAQQQALATTCIDINNTTYQHEADDNLTALNNPNDLAYVIYTSGTTGKPKGVMIEHHSVNNMARMQQREFNVTNNSVILQFASLSFDASVSEIFCTLNCGAKLCISSDIERKEPEKLIRLIQRNKVTIATFPPALLANFPYKKIDSLKTIIVAGESCKISIVNLWRKERTFINAYGPTENTVCTTLNIYKNNDSANNIGKPLDNIKVYLLDKEHNPVSIGETGEIHIGGAGVARGYWNQPQLTQQRFIDNPFATITDIKKGYKKLYKTGDLARFLPNGNIEYIGRNDFQVKIRSHRVELKEIENTIIQFEEIKQNIVLIFTSENKKEYNEQLVVYYVSEKAIPKTTFLNYLLQRLPAYMIPSAFVHLQALPLTINGKIDRNALPKPSIEAENNEYIAPRNEQETQLCHIWKTLLDVERVGIGGNFFHLGGHSLLAMQCAYQMSHVLNKKIDVADIFAHKTIIDLVEQLGQADIITIPTSNIEYPPLSYAQERLWFVEQYEHGSDAYHIPMLFELPKEANQTALTQSLNALLQRHDILRTVIKRKNDGTHAQVILDTTLIISQYQYDTEDAYQKQLENDIYQTYDLQNEIPIRASLYTVKDKRYLLINIHHIAFDGWSADIFIQELSQYYAHFQDQQALSLAPLTIQYKDFAIWQRQYLTGDRLDVQLQYWKNKLQGYETLQLPIDKTRPIEVEHQGNTILFDFSEKLSIQLRDYAKAQNCTLYSVLLSGFYVFLHHYTGQDDLILGSPIANRHYQQLQHLIGFLVNNLALRIQLDPNDTLSSLIQTVQHELIDAQRHQDIPFEQVVNALALPQDRSRHPLFQVMFGVQGFAQGSNNSVFNPINIETTYTAAKFDLSCFIDDSQEILSGSINYATSLFSKDTIERMIVHYRQILKAIVEKPQQAIGAVEILTPAEYQQMVYGWNQTERDYPQNKTLHQLFEEQVENTPNNIAVVYEDQHRTYGQLNQQANQLARHIRRCYEQTTEQSLEPDTLIALCVERGIDMIVAIFAVLKAGGAYVPVDPNYPDERIAYILQDTQTKFVLTQAPLQTRLQTLAQQQALATTCIDIDNMTYQHEARDNLTVLSKPNDLAYVIYTSGTTGKPKGVMIEQSSFVSFIQGFKDKLGLSKFNTLSLTQYTFDIFGLEYSLPLINGYSVILSSIDKFEKTFVENQNHIDIIQQTPTVFNSLLEQIPQTKNIHNTTCLVGGETSSKNLIQKLNTIFKEVINVYGPTETTIWSSSYTSKDNLNFIGEPLYNEQLYILNRTKKPVPKGVIGEIHIGGAGVARGYWNQPQLTQQCFIDNPFATTTDIKKGYKKLYKTGDLARYLPNGNIEYIGRNDFQVKIRGHRVELGEIENVVLEIENIEQCIVIPYLNNNKEEQNCLVAYYVASCSLDDNFILAKLSTKLPDYMIPSVFVHLKALPLTVNGKIDRNALPKPSFEAENNEYIAPRNEQEAQLCYIWKTLLDIERVGIGDNFFHLGGHSLLAMQCAYQMSHVVNKQIDIADIFAHKTIVDLVEQLGKVDIINITVSKDPSPSLSYAQERLWFVEQYEHGSDAYHIPMLFELPKEANQTALMQSLNALLQRHDILRTVIKQEAGTYIQLILDTTLVISQYQYNTEDAYQKQLENDIYQTFDLQNEVPIRAILYTVKDKRYLLINIHHIAFDGWSADIFIQELSQYYAHFQHQQTLSLAPLTIQYKDFAIWQRQYLTGDRLDVQLQYWKNKLQGYETLQLPIDKTRPIEVEHQGNTILFDFSEKLSIQLRDYAKAQNCTLYSVLLSGFYVFLHHYTGQDDLILGSPIANRHYQQLQHLIGFLVNNLALRIQLDPNDTLSSLIQTVQHELIDAQRHQDIPFEQVVNALALPQDRSRHPLFQVMFGVQGFAQANTDSIFKLVNLETTYTAAKFDLSCFIDDSQEILSGSINYATSLFNKDTIERMIVHYQQILKAIVEKPQQAIGAVEVLTPAEYQQMVYDWNQTERDYPQNKTLHQLFEEQVENTPNNIAVVYEDQYMTYGQLNQQANQLARHIRRCYEQTTQQSLEPDTLIALCVERGIDMIVAIFAILKAGGAYVPVDPNYPDERIAYILQDTQTKFVLTQAPLQTRLQTLAQQQALATTCIDIDNMTYQHEAKDNLTALSKPNDLAYVIYTSGTTGKPKGVMIEHHSVNNMARMQQREFNVTNNSVILQFASIVFDASVWETFNALTSGARLVVASDKKRYDVDNLIEYIKKQKVTIATIPPTLLAQAKHETTLDLKTLIVAGETCDKETSAIWSNNRDLVNAYGPSESTVCVSLKHNQSNLNNTVIGKAIQNTKIFILDENLNPVPIGVIGEIHISGQGLARGYLNKADLTKEKFVRNPFVENSNGDKGYQKLYKTGDLARFLPDGNIEYIGRNDFQVKIRGYRVELSGIEATLLEEKNINKCKVTTNDKENNQQLIAYYVSSSPLEQDILQNNLSKKLPEYMLPDFYIHLNDFPLTVNGKIDLDALPKAPILKNIDQHQEPRNELEEALCEIWKKLLEIDSIGINDNFFHVGGNSILAIQLVAKISEVLNAKIEIADIFICKTIANMAKHICYGNIVPIEAKSGNIAPLSYAQERLWFIDQYEQGNNAYNIPLVFSLYKETNVDDFIFALQDIINRHKILRSIFIQKHNSTDYQVIVNQKPIIEKYNFTNKRNYIKQLNSDVNMTFDLRNEIPIRIYCYYLESGQGRINCNVLVNIHHIAFDGWSTEIFIHELDQLYRIHNRQDNSCLPELGIQYKDYALWKRNYIQGETLKTQLNYWRKKLNKLESLDFPLDYPRPAKHDYQGANFNFLLPVSLSVKVRKFAQEKGCSLFSVLLTGFYILLYKYSCQKDIVIGTPTANRHHPQTQALIGCFINTLVLRANFDNQTSVNDLLKIVNHNLIEAQRHQDIPFEQLVKYLKVDRDVSRHPLFQIMFNVQSFSNHNRKYDWGCQDNQSIINNSAKLDLSCFIDTSKKQLKGYINYATSLFKQETIKRISKHYEIVLENMLSCGTKISKLQLLTEREQKQILYKWNSTDFKYESTKALPEIFYETASKFSNSIALKLDNETITYNELNKKSNQLADFILENYLPNNDVECELPIVLCLDRSIDMFIAILAILKVGGAYVPISPDYPQERISYIINDTNTKLVLTQSHLKKKLIECLSKDNTNILSVDKNTYVNNKTSNLSIVNDPRRLAYIIYTSGTTGKPKGVMIEQRSVMNHLYGLLDILDNSVKNVDYSSNIAFDFSVATTLVPLLLGKTVCIYAKELTDIDSYISHLNVHSIDFVKSTPAYFSQIAVDKLKSKIKKCIVAGEKLETKQLENLLECTEYLYNEYGPTETTVGATICLKNKGDVGHIIGKPFKNYKTYILDNELNAVPIGVKGELYISGAGLARGYWGKINLTKDRFINNPFTTEEDKQKGYTHLYKTGDIVRYLPDGNIEYIERNDFQVKIRGYRIELHEIENAICKIEEIHQAIVIPYEKEVGKNKIHYLVGYYISQESINKDIIEDKLHRYLPKYMMPTIFVHLEELPLTVNGKIDRKLLPMPDFNATNKQYIAPSNNIQNVLCKIWKELLGIDKISINDDFFHLGGDSLLTIQLANRIIKYFKISLSLKEIIENPTIASISNKISDNPLSSNITNNIVKFNHRKNNPIISYEQRLLIDYIKEDPKTTLFQSGISLIINQAINLEHFKSSIQLLIKDYPLFRTLFRMKNDTVRPEILDKKKVKIETILTNEEKNIRDIADIKSYAEQERIKLAQKIYDYNTEFLYNFKLIKVKDDCYILICCFSKLVTDGYSLSMFLEKLFDNYLNINKKSKFSPKEQYNYFDYSEWQQENSKQQITKQKLLYWKNKYKDFPQRSLLNEDKVRPKKLQGLCNTIKKDLSVDLTNKIRNICSENKISSYSIFFAVWSYFLNKKSNVNDFSIACLHRNRNRIELENIHGPFSDYLPIRIVMTEENIRNQINYFKNIDGLIKEDLDNAIPYSLMLDELNVADEEKFYYCGFPITQTAVNFPSPFNAKECREEKILFDVIENTRHTTSLDISVEISENINLFSVSFNYRGEIFHSITMKDYLDEFIVLLNDTLSML